MKPESTPSLTSGELEVMEILWREGELKPAEIQERFRRPIKNPALRSYLSILCEKGHLTRRKEGKAYVYAPVTERNQVRRHHLRELLDRFFDGSARSLVLNLVESEKLSPEDIAELQQIAREADNQSENDPES